jgi:hypothetical protein
MDQNISLTQVLSLGTAQLLLQLYIRCFQFLPFFFWQFLLLDQGVFWTLGKNDSGNGRCCPKNVRLAVCPKSLC